MANAADFDDDYARQRRDEARRERQADDSHARYQSRQIALRQQGAASDDILALRPPKAHPEYEPSPRGPEGDHFETEQREIAGRAGRRQARRLNILDSSKMHARHRRLIGTYQLELDRHAANRYEQSLDDDFYDHIQWNEEDAAIVEERGQVPLVFNIIATPVNWVIGTEKRGRSDFKILPRRKEDGKPAERKTQLLKYLSDVNHSAFSRSSAFEQTVKVGVGWLEDGWQDEDDGEPLYCRAENWRNMLWDSTANEKDLSDARYIFRSKWFDFDVAAAIFPDRKHILARSVESAGPYLSIDNFSDEAMDSIETGNASNSAYDGEDSLRERVRLIEAWHREPVQVDVIRGGVFSGEIFDPASIGHVDAINRGDGEIVKKMRMRMHVTILCTSGTLWHSVSPYRHNQFPFTPIWGYRRGRDNMPYGLIRGLRDIQADVNKRASKAIHILNSNKVIMDEGAVDDIDEFREEVARPDAVIVKAYGKELRIDVDREMTQWQTQMMMNHIALAEKAAGVNDDNLGRQTNASSGIAIARRQEQGSMVTTIFFDNLRLASQIQGEKQLANVEQFMSAKKQFRITNMRGRPDFITVNDDLPENDIVRSKADYVISEADWRATLREQAVAEFMDIIAKFPPEISIQMLDLLVDEMDVKNREEIVKRIRAISGQRDPDADPNEITPEEAAKAEKMAKQEQLQEQSILGQIKKLLAESMLKEAQAKQVSAKTAGDNVGSQNQALLAAREAMLTPAAVPVADFILDQAGFTSKSDEEDQTRQIAETMAAAQAQQQQQPPAPAGNQGPPQNAAIGLGM